MASARRRRWITVTLAGLAVSAGVAALLGRPPAAAAKPGVVTTLDGQPYSGDVVEDGGYVFVTTAGAKVKLDRRNVTRIDYAADVKAEYDTRHGKLAANDVKGRVDLAHWANEHSRPDLALSSLEEARQIDPTNRDVALAMQTVQRQMDLDRAAGKGNAAAAAGGPQASAATRPAATNVAAGTMPHRLLDAAEINVIRQVEMRPDDRLVKVRLENNVARKYMLGAFGDTTGAKAKRFALMSGQDQALAILTEGSPEMKRDVHILTDPTPLHLFKTKVMPILAQGCASTACHGGANAGDFVLYEGSTTPAVYTNFYILMTYTAEINGVQYLPLDREVPERSLALQFGLPSLRGRPPHPAVAGWHARFKGADDPAYVAVTDFLNNDLRVIQHNYGFDVSPRLLPGQMPATLPATPPPGGTPPAEDAAPRPPATRPAPEHGTPLPREYPGGPTTLPAAP